MKKQSIRKIGELILRDKALKILATFNIVIILLIFASIILGSSYKEKAIQNENEIQQIKQTLANLEKLANTNISEPSGIENKRFAEYEEVIPFITSLEGIFTVVDPEAELTIRSSESQILTDHFADYRVRLRIEGREEIFLQALDELYKSVFVTKITSFSIIYQESFEGGGSEPFEVTMSIRLFLL